MAIDYAQVSMEIVGLTGVLIFSFYAVKLLGSFRHGVLEKGWKEVTQGAIILALAQIPFLVAGIYPTSFNTALVYAGNLFRFIGLAFLILGFRTQYQVWRLDNKDLPQKVNQTEVL